MAALPKKKISKVRGKTRRAHNRATLTDLVSSTKFPGLSLPHRFRRFFDSLEATDKSIVRVAGGSRRSQVSQTVKKSAKPAAKVIKPKADGTTAEKAAEKKSRKTAAHTKMPNDGK